MSKAIRFRNRNNEPLYVCPYYPVGSIYLSVNNFNPGTIFGGTWEQIKDRFLLGAGNTYSAGATGGSATHTLSINEMPSHKHSLGYRIGGGSGSTWYIDGGTVDSWGGDTAVSSTGGNQPHNNMPPYLVVYIWKRIG